MITFLHLCLFHLKVFSKNNYFVSLLLTTIVSFFILQYLIMYSDINYNDQSIWIRTSLIGMWTLSVTAAGTLNFQRFMGTLPYLFGNNFSNSLSLLAVITPSATFGLFSIPMSLLLAFLFGFNISISLFDILIFAIIYLSFLQLSYIIACFFVLTKNSMVYEVLLTYPILILSGIYQLPESINNIMKYLLPQSGPINYLLYGTELSITALLFSFILWSVISIFITKFIFLKIKKTGSLEII